MIIAVDNSKTKGDLRQCFDLFSEGTGAFVQNVRIIQKLKDDLSYEIFSDPDLSDFWSENEIKYIKRDLHLEVLFC